jgi:hypothetical protein
MKKNPPSDPSAASPTRVVSLPQSAVCPTDGAERFDSAAMPYSNETQALAAVGGVFFFFLTIFSFLFLLCFLSEG